MWSLLDASIIFAVSNLPTLSSWRCTSKCVQSKQSSFLPRSHYARVHFVYKSYMCVCLSVCLFFVPLCTATVLSQISSKIVFWTDISFHTFSQYFMLPYSVFVFYVLIIAFYVFKCVYFISSHATDMHLIKSNLLTYLLTYFSMQCVWLSEHGQNNQT